MQKYLVKEVTSFYGSKGFDEEGGTETYVSESPIFGIIKDGDTFRQWDSIDDLTKEEIEEYGITKENYTETIEGYVSDDDCIQGEDGYTASTLSYYFKPITDEEATHATYIIEEYAKL